jgi:hypothetical protein
MVGLFGKCPSSILCAMVILIGCTNSKMIDSDKKSPLEFEYDAFVPVKKECMTHLRDTVGKTYGKDYAFKNAIRSREKPYLEAIFSKIEGGGNTHDSAIVVKFDDLCNIKIMYRSLMTFEDEQSR